MQSENIAIFPITVGSTFVTLSWNTSSSLSTAGRGYILQVAKERDDGGEEEIIKQYEDIDVGLKMNSYTVTGLAAGEPYLFRLCLRRGGGGGGGGSRFRYGGGSQVGSHVIPVSSAVLVTRPSGFEADLGIETDYASLAAVAGALTALLGSCVGISVVRFWRYNTYYAKDLRRAGRGRSVVGVGCASGGDTSSQREMIASPSDHSSVTASSGGMVKKSPSSGTSAAGASMSASASMACCRSACHAPNGVSSISAAAAVQPQVGPVSHPPPPPSSVRTGEQSRLMDNEVTSPVEEIVRETIA